MDSVELIEVGPRDGLQNEKQPIPTELKRGFIAGLAEAGCQEIEATSFVSPKWVPQLSDAVELWNSLPPGPKYSALVPNTKGLERALECRVQRIAVFTASSEAFTLKNLNMTIGQSINTFQEVISQFRAQTPEAWVRGYVSTAFECPYSGRVAPEQTCLVAAMLVDIGVDELSIGDTIGVAVPAEVTEFVKRLADNLDLSKVAFHFHDTRGTAVANAARAYELGIRRFDSSAGGLGGCPYAPGAGGNIATEDLVYFFERSGIKTSIDLEKLSKASLSILEMLGRPPSAKAQRAFLAAGSCPQ